jgi:uncharacterized protein involved in exopolysaccharide biosynthesis
MGREQVFNDSVDLREYLTPLMRQKRLIALVALLVLAAAALYTFSRTPVYKATATVLLKPTGVNLADLGALGSEKLVNLETESQLVKSTAVATSAGAELGTGATPAEALKHVSVTVVPDSQTLEISYSDPDPTRAQQGAMAFARAYLDDRQAQAEDLVDTQRQALDAKLANAQCELDGTQCEDTGTIPPDVGATASDKEALRQEISSLSAQLT